MGISSGRIKRRKSIGRAYSGKSVFGAKIVCGDCGGFYGFKTWHSTDKYKTVIWQCNRKFKDNTCCKTPHITEDEIKARFLKVYNGLISDKEPFIKACKLTRDVLTDTKEIDSEISELLRELEVVTELIKNSSVFQMHQTTQNAPIIQLGCICIKIRDLFQIRTAILIQSVS